MTGLCSLLGDWNGQIPTGGAWVEEKKDGFRCLWFRGIDGKARLWTRNGLPISGCDHIAYRLSLFEKVAGCPLFLDGELVVDGTLAATKRWVETDWRKGGEKGLFHAFDILADPEWRAGGGDMPLYARKAWLADIVGKVDNDPALSWEWRPRSFGRDEGATPVVLVEDQWAYDAGEVIEMAGKIWAAGGEGCVVKDCETPYRRKRSNDWVKVKKCNMNKWRHAA